MAYEKIKEMVGLALLAEGVVGFAYPARYTAFWDVGPKWLDKLRESATRNPEVMRTIYAAEAALGFWIAKRQLGDLRDREPRRTPSTLHRC